jgi:GAF domain-containing protein
VSRDDSRSPSLRDQTQQFLQDFFTKGESLVRDLIEENERLRSALDDKGTPVVAGSSELLSRLVRQVEDLENECAEIRKIAGSMERESGGYRERLDALEGEHYHLAAMYVAGNQFHSATSIEELLRTTTEILLNFVGVGGFTVFAVDESTQRFFSLATESGAQTDGTELPLSEAGEPDSHRPWKQHDPLGGGQGALMRLPLVSGTRLMGMVRIESFLPQKLEFVETDFGLLELISEHAGIGIENAWVRAHAKDSPLRREALERLVGA